MCMPIGAKYRGSYSPWAENTEVPIREEGWVPVGSFHARREQRLLNLTSGSVGVHKAVLEKAPGGGPSRPGGQNPTKRGGLRPYIKAEGVEEGSVPAHGRARAVPSIGVQTRRQPAETQRPARARQPPVGQ